MGVKIIPGGVKEYLLHDIALKAEAFLLEHDGNIKEDEDEPLDSELRFYCPMCDDKSRTVNIEHESTCPYGQLKQALFAGGFLKEWRRD